MIFLQFTNARPGASDMKVMVEWNTHREAGLFEIASAVAPAKDDGCQGRSVGARGAKLVIVKELPSYQRVLPQSLVLTRDDPVLQVVVQVFHLVQRGHGVWLGKHREVAVL
eukprot:scaffold13_cov241-Pinguiococcus_pyrenoidosus.AAC.15